MSDNIQLLSYQSCFTDVISCYITSCGTNEDIRDYEKTLLEKCIDDNDNIILGNSASYEPPILSNMM